MPHVTERGGVMKNPENTTAETEEITAEMLVEEVSIDGMCGVY